MYFRFQCHEVYRFCAHNGGDKVCFIERYLSELLICFCKYDAFDVDSIYLRLCITVLLKQSCHLYCVRCCHGYLWQKGVTVRPVLQVQICIVRISIRLCNEPDVYAASYLSAMH